MKHEYLTLNGKVVYEKIGEGSSAKIMIFSYDALGRPFAVKYSKNNGSSFTNYFYVLNQQGDVVKIFRPDPVKDANGNTTGYVEKVYATYTYDAWGKLIGITNYAGESLLNRPNSTALANVNPLRYRGYYYDTETGFYYLQSRYYDPAVRRFINADSYASTGQGFVGVNMFAYCNNNPVMYADDGGDAPWWLLPFWGFIHMMVEEDIIKKNPQMGWLRLEQPIYYPDSSKHSRADVCNIMTGEVWEIKSCGPASLTANAQLEKYCTGYLKTTGLKVRRGQAVFWGEFEVGDFTVVYWSSEPGVVLYSFDVKEPKKEKALAVVPVPQKAPERAGKSLILPICGIPRFSGGGGMTDDTKIAVYCR